MSVPQFAFVRRLPNGGHEAGQVLEDGKGCDPCLPCTFGEQLREAFSCCMEKRACAAISPVCDTRGVQFEGRTGNFAWLLVWSLGEMANGSKGGNEDIVDKQVEEESQVVESGNEPDKSPQAFTDKGSVGKPMGQWKTMRAGVKTAIQENRR